MTKVFSFVFFFYIKKGNIKSELLMLSNMKNSVKKKKGFPKKDVMLVESREIHGRRSNLTNHFNISLIVNNSNSTVIKNTL